MGFNCIGNREDNENVYMSRAFSIQSSHWSRALSLPYMPPDLRMAQSFEWCQQV